MQLKSKIKLIVSTIIILIVSVVAIKFKDMNVKNQINVKLRVPVYTADTYKYDLDANHSVWTSVFGTLVSGFQTGKYTGVISERWEVTEDGKNWRFILRKGLRFSNGDPINSDAVCRSFKRIFWLQKKGASEESLANLLIGNDKITSINSDFEGMICNENSLTFKLKEKKDNFLEIVSFGLYGVTHNNDYDSQGKWTSKNAVVSSGAYKLDFWNKSQVVISLRDDYPGFTSFAQRASKVVFFWDDSLESDIEVRTNLYSDLANKGFTFHGPVPSTIWYVKCSGWENSDSICHSVENRRWLRNEFYKGLRKKNWPLATKFLPLSSTASENVQVDKPKNLKGLTFSWLVPSEIKELPPHMVLIKSIFSSIAEKNGLAFSTKRDASYAEALDEDHGIVKQHTFDLINLGTAIKVEDPDADIRFMFLSKEGIHLPDTNGQIRDELKKSKLDTDLINKLIWDQAVVWPFMHLSDGLWVKDHIDLSKANTMSSALDFNGDVKNLV